MVPRVEPVPLGSGGRNARRYGVCVTCVGVHWVNPEPITVVRLGGATTGTWRSYTAVETLVDGFDARGRVRLGPRAALVVEDKWRASADNVVVSRRATIEGYGDGAFMTALSLARDVPATWGDVVPFAPGAAYGDSEPVPPRAVFSPSLRRSGACQLLVREDRLSAPMLALLYPDSLWVAFLREPDGSPTSAGDLGSRNGGETLVDEGFGFASLGGLVKGGRLHFGVFFPGTEGPVTYSIDGRPLSQHQRWRRRFHPVREGVTQCYDVRFTWGRASGQLELFEGAWRWAWADLAPTAPAVAPDEVVETSTRVLASQVVHSKRCTGLPLEVDAVTGLALPGSPAIMGFVGANTDAGFVLLRVGEMLGGTEGAQWASLGEAVVGSFTRLDLGPPTGEGFDLGSGQPVTYRKEGGVPAVFARSVADGCSGALKAWAYEASKGREHRRWLAWAQSGGDWLVSAQRVDGSLPRAWEAGTGKVLDPSPTASHVPVAFLTRLARATGKTIYLDSALRSARFAWSAGGEIGCYAGATLDNPDVVDKEAAVYALEGFLELYATTGEDVWLERAVSAATVAETWVYVWDIAMPADVPETELHWKPGVPTAGQQLIAAGVSTCDGFLAVNAAAFATLYNLTGDQHFLDVARLVSHGTKAMLARPGRTFDLKGVGWQQEHWCYSIPRGRGLTRDWLPWVAVAGVEGILRLWDLGDQLAHLVLD